MLSHKFLSIVVLGLIVGVLCVYGIGLHFALTEGPSWFGRTVGEAVNAYQETQQ